MPLTASQLSDPSLSSMEWELSPETKIVVKESQDQINSSPVQPWQKSTFQFDAQLDAFGLRFMKSRSKRRFQRRYIRSRGSRTILEGPRSLTRAALRFGRRPGKRLVMGSRRAVNKGYKVGSRKVGFLYRFLRGRTAAALPY